MKHIIITIISLFIINTFTMANDTVKLLELPKEGIDNLDIDCEAGFLKVYGIEGLDKIEVKAEIVVDISNKEDRENFIRDRVRLSLERRGNKAVLISHIDNHSFFSRHELINLTVRMPQKMNLKVDDGSGSMEIKDIVGDLSIDDGSGGIDITNITGNVHIDDGSGEVNLNTITGYVEVEDGSGELEIENITGDLNVDDGSGSLRISNIAGNVIITDGSGSIDIDGVDKDVTIKEAGSGGLSIHDVKGRVEKRD